MPRGIASNGEVSYSVTNLYSALSMLMAVYVYGEDAVKDTKRIALENTTGVQCPSGMYQKNGKCIFCSCFCFMQKCNNITGKCLTNCTHGYRGENCDESIITSLFSRKIFF
ncbi:hypothetical protein ElyMa_002431300 [Elysia marginata]|uniref:EGF-like domain-containing protein n=1 Tax=Elysia marginata TaxID=1093978 RepID=A0AAV4GIV2_9GAST|nr:hypothetical protein ElyMa_002431300 [Elysia marginata]